MLKALPPVMIARSDAGMDAVVAQIAHPAQDDRLREVIRALGVAGAQLAQQRDQGVADQGVHLVEQQHDGARRSPRTSG